uniref:Uncharacterized protein n=1 Tax=Rhipicephalus zambeziensis TaxID=60191 RepID=A0A224YGE8_9ACAR
MQQFHCSSIVNFNQHTGDLERINKHEIKMKKTCKTQLMHRKTNEHVSHFLVIFISCSISIFQMCTNQLAHLRVTLSGPVV